MSHEHEPYTPKRGDIVMLTKAVGKEPAGTYVHIAKAFPPIFIGKTYDGTHKVLIDGEFTAPPSKVSKDEFLSGATGVVEDE